MRIYLNGSWVEPAEAKISVFDHGLLYGDGVFEGMRSYNGVVFRLKEHLERLKRSAQTISLVLPQTLEEISGLVQESLKVNKLEDSYIRLLVTRGEGDLGLDPRACSNPSLVIITDQITLFPKKCYEEGLEAAFVKTRRNITEALNPTIKSMNYLNNILAKIEANELGVPEGIMLNHQGYVAECSGDNVFFVKGKEIFTPPVSAGILVGITREAVIQLIQQKTSYQFQEKLFKPEELMAADEVFFTGTAAEVIPVTKIDKKPIGTSQPEVATKELINLFRALIKSETVSKRKTAL